VLKALRGSRTGIRVVLVGAAVTALTLASASALHSQVYDMLVPTHTYSPLAGCGDGVSESAVCQTDNAGVTYYMRSGDLGLESADRTVVDNVLDRDYRPTVLAFTHDSTPVWSGSSETDWIYEEGPVAGEAEGVTVCNDESLGCMQKETVGR
jgi:hypothetical protein